MRIVPIIGIPSKALPVGFSPGVDEREDNGPRTTVVELNLRRSVGTFEDTGGIGHFESPDPFEGDPDISGPDKGLQYGGVAVVGIAKPVEFASVDVTDEVGGSGVGAIEQL